MVLFLLFASICNHSVLKVRVCVCVLGFILAYVCPVHLPLPFTVHFIPHLFLIPSL